MILDEPSGNTFGGMFFRGYFSVFFFSFHILLGLPNWVVSSL